jgi:hypothetical protein
MRNYRSIGNYYVSNICLETFPCQHYIKTSLFGKETHMFGDDIYRMCKNCGITDKHFEQYKEYISEIDNRTPLKIEEIKKQIEIRQTEMEKQNEEFFKEGEELLKIVNKHKASSYLEKLKSKNNISKPL